MLRWKILQVAILAIGAYNVMTSLSEHKSLGLKLISCDNIWERVIEVICQSKCFYDLGLGAGILFCMTMGQNLCQTLEDLQEWIFFYSCLFPLNAMILAIKTAIGDGEYVETMNFSWVTLQAFHGVLVLIYINHLEGLLALEESRKESHDSKFKRN